MNKKQIVQLGATVLGDGIPKICVPVVGKTLDQILAQGKEAASVSPDLIEWRVDFYQDIMDPIKRAEAIDLLKEAVGDIPILFTFRSSLEGGEMEISPSDYDDLCTWAAWREETAIIDIEARREDLDAKDLITRLHGMGKPIIASNHHFTRTPGDQELDRIFTELEASGADILKLAVMPQTAQDVIRLLAATERQNRATDKPVITMSMSALGAVSRVSGALTGSALTFGTVSQASAPGQIPVASLREIFKVLG